MSVRRVFPAVAAESVLAVRRARPSGRARRARRADGAPAVRARVGAGGAPAQRAPAAARPAQPCY